MEPKQVTYPKNPWISANVLKKITFVWLSDLVKTSWRKDLQECDVYEVLEEFSSSHVGNHLERLWNEELASKEKGKTPNLLDCLFKMCRKQVILWSVIGCLSITLRIGQTYLLSLVAQYFSLQSDVTRKEAYYYSAGLILCTVTVNILHYSYLYNLNCLGNKMRTALATLIYKKVVKLKNTSDIHDKIGHVVNLMSNDLTHFDITFWYFPTTITGPIQILPACIISYLQIGYPAFIAIAFLLIFGTTASVIEYKVVSSSKQKFAKKTSDRVKLMSEIISGMKVIKMYAWEKSFKKLIDLHRRSEIKYLQTITIILSLVPLKVLAPDRIAMLVLLISATLLGRTFSSKNVYGLFSLLSVLRAFIVDIPGLSMVFGAMIVASVKRIQMFLMLDEVNYQNDQEVQKNESDPIINMLDVSAKWTSHQPQYTLQGLNIKLNNGCICAVVGSVGCGKSSLLQILLRELQLDSGSLSVNGSISYVSQDSWIFLGTVKQNILFGETYEKEKYERAIDICALRRDLEIFPNGDETIVGEKGLCLSGGQKSRINLARAIYKDADIYLLDDPLSAVDTKVGHQIFQQCILDYLSTKTRILVTHQLQYLSQVDWIILIKNGQIEMQGTWEDFKENQNNFIELYQHEDNPITEKLLTCDTISGVASTNKNGGKQYELQENTGKGSVKFSTFSQYIKSGGSAFFLFMLGMVLIFTQICISGADYFVSYWIKFEESQAHEMSLVSSNTSYEQEIYLNFSHKTTGDFMLLHGIIILFLLLFLIIRSFCFSYFSQSASKTLHNKMLENILSAKMTFFNWNSSGRILNRFSNDIGVIDEKLVRSLGDTVSCFSAIIGTTVVLILVNYMTIIGAFISYLLLTLMMYLYVMVVKSLKRLHCTAESTVLSHVTETMNGLIIIRSRAAEDMVLKTFYQLEDRCSSCSHLLTGISATMCFWNENITVLWTLILITLFFSLPQEQLDSSIGLALTLLINFSIMSQFVMRQIAEAYNHFISVERAIQYTHLDKEYNIQSSPGKSLFPVWPTEGSIIFENVSLKYDESDMPALKNLSFRISPGQKVGIVGRTGAGKSSLISAIFHLSKYTGRIIIDDVDISQISLEELRQNISIIPQDTVLFSASLRYNLDPFGKFKDTDLYNALEETELKEEIDNLDMQISNGGLNLSVGQRQLICLARAILRNNKILVLDEATANVDEQTDNVIQKSIKRRFKNCTVLTIAHRLNTIMDCDKVMVMDSGTLVEYEHPYVLLQNKNGHFYNLVQEMGEKHARNMFLIAQQAFLHPEDTVTPF